MDRIALIQLTNSMLSTASTVIESWLQSTGVNDAWLFPATGGAPLPQA